MSTAKETRDQMQRVGVPCKWCITWSSFCDKCDAKWKMFLLQEKKGQQ